MLSTLFLAKWVTQLAGSSWMPLLKLEIMCSLFADWSLLRLRRTEVEVICIVVYVFFFLGFSKV